MRRTVVMAVLSVVGFAALVACSSDSPSTPAVTNTVPGTSTGVATTSTGATTTASILGGVTLDTALYPGGSAPGTIAPATTAQASAAATPAPTLGAINGPAQVDMTNPP